jgi:hypothetical protein
VKRVGSSALGRELKRNVPAIVFGALIMIGGVVAVFHQQFSYSVEQHYAQVGPEKILFETRKMFHLPLWFSIPMIGLGAAIMIAGMRKA